MVYNKKIHNRHNERGTHKNEMKTVKKKMTAAVLLAMTLLCGCGSVIETSTEFVHYTRADTSSSSQAEAEPTPEEDEMTTDTQEESIAEEIPDESSEAEFIAETAEEQSEMKLEEFPVSDEPINVWEGATEEMIGRSLLYRGDTSRLAAKIDRALSDPDAVTKICFLGDSITDGTGASYPQYKYVELCRSWWEENIGENVEIINSGIGATDSYCGVHRASQDATGYMADIYVIEFINDYDDELYSQTMDSLIRMCLSQPNYPAVMLIEASHLNRAVPQGEHYKAASAYGTAMISYHDAIMPEINAGNFAWADISGDSVHPNDAGHSIMAACVTNYWGSVLDNIEDEKREVVPFDPETPSPTGDKFKNARMGTRSTPSYVTVIDEGDFTKNTNIKTFTEGWRTEEGGRIEFEMSFKNLGILFCDDIDAGHGTAIITIDGEDSILLDANSSVRRIRFANNIELYTSQAEQTHRVTVEILEDSDNDDFDILAWLIS